MYPPMERRLTPAEEEEEYRRRAWAEYLRVERGNPAQHMEHREPAVRDPHGQWNDPHGQWDDGRRPRDTRLRDRPYDDGRYAERTDRRDMRDYAHDQRDMSSGRFRPPASESSGGFGTNSRGRESRSIGGSSDRSARRRVVTASSDARSPAYDEPVSASYVHKEVSDVAGTLIAEPGITPVRVGEHNGTTVYHYDGSSRMSEASDKELVSTVVCPPVAINSPLGDITYAGLRVATAADPDMIAHQTLTVERVYPLVKLASRALSSKHDTVARFIAALSADIKSGSSAAKHLDALLTDVYGKMLRKYGIETTSFGEDYDEVLKMLGGDGESVVSEYIASTELLVGAVTSAYTRAGDSEDDADLELLYLEETYIVLGASVEAALLADDSEVRYLTEASAPVLFKSLSDIINAKQALVYILTDAGAYIVTLSALGKQVVISKY